MLSSIHVKQNHETSRIRVRVGPRIKPYFLLGDSVCVNKKVGTVPTCSRRIFSLTNFNQSRCGIFVFALCHANKVAKWKIGLTIDIYLSH